MDTSNWRGPQGGNGAIGDSSMESGDWRAQLQADSRQRIVNKIMDTLKRHLPFSGHEGLQELKKIAVRFEEKIYTAATSQSDYLRKISLKMLTMETRSQNSMPEAMQANSGANSVNPSDPGSQVMQQVNSQGQPLPIPVPSNQNQQFLSQTMHNNMGSSGIQGSSSLSSALPPGTGLPQSSNIASQNPTLQNMSGSQQGNTMGPTNFANQRQIPGRQQPQQPQQQQQQPQQQQQQQQNQNSHYAYQQQLQQMAKQKLQGNNIAPSMQQIQQQQQNLLQQPSVMQPTMMQSVQNQPQSSQPMMNHQQQSALRQQRQQVQVQPTQQQVQPTQSNSMGQQQQPNATNMQQNQLMGVQQNNTYSNMQQNQLMGQQNKPQQHLIGQHNNLSGMQQQHMGGGGGGGGGGGQSGVSGGQQQQMLGTQSGNSGMQHMMQSKIPVQSSGALLPTQPQQQSQPQVMPHMQTQSGQVAMQQQQQQQQQPNMMQQRLPNAGGFQQQNVIDQQKQLFQQQRPMQEASSTSLDSTAQTSNPNGGAWQEEVYQKIKAMKDLYLLDLNDMHQKILGKLQQHDSLPQQPKNEQLEKLKVFKNMLERFMAFLQIPKHNILANYKDKLSTYEKQIVHVITSNRRKPGPTQQQQQQQQQQPQQLPPPHMQSQSQQTHSQLTHEIPMTSQMQTVSSLSGGSNSQQQTMMNSMQPSSNLDSVSGGGPQSQQVNINPMVSHGAMGTLQPNPNPNLLHIKQQEQLLQSQQLKQLQNRQMHQQFVHKQQLMQQQQQFRQQQQQVNQVNQLSQLHDAGDIKLRQQQQMGVKPATFQQQQRTGGYHQQMKPGGSPFSPQLIPGGGGSPQISQHASPQIDQQNMFKPMQSANSPFTVPSPSTPSTSPLPGDFERITALTNAGHGQGQGQSVLTSQSLAIGTPGISASPLLAEFTSPDGTTTTGVVASISGKSNGAEQPLERLLKVVKSISATALTSSVGDIGSVVSMIDRIAGSAPGNGSRAAVGEDLVAMTKCRLQARTFVNQDGTNGVRKMKRFTSAMPLNVVSSAGSVNDSFKQLSCVETSELDSTASSKRPRVESNHALLEELKEINRGLIDTVVDISEEDVDPAAASSASEGADGTVVKCSFSAVALGPNLKSQYASAQMSPIQPLRLLVPANYPNCSPILLDKFPVEVSKEYEDLSVKAKSRFSISLRSLSQPMSLKEIAKTWDVCARAVISEYAQLSGGGTFSSKYGTWDNCLTAV